jgi:hypothetical protein
MQLMDLEDALKQWHLRTGEDKLQDICSWIGSDARVCGYLRDKVLVRLAAGRIYTPRTGDATKRGLLPSALVQARTIRETPERAESPIEPTIPERDQWEAHYRALAALKPTSLMMKGHEFGLYLDLRLERLIQIDMSVKEAMGEPAENERVRKLHELITDGGILGVTAYNPTSKRHLADSRIGLDGYQAHRMAELMIGGYTIIQAADLADIGVLENRAELVTFMRTVMTVSKDSERGRAWNERLSEGAEWVAKLPTDAHYVAVLHPCPESAKWTTDWLEVAPLKWRHGNDISYFKATTEATQYAPLSYRGSPRTDLKAADVKIVMEKTVKLALVGQLTFPLSGVENCTESQVRVATDTMAKHWYRLLAGMPCHKHLGTAQRLRESRS